MTSDDGDHRPFVIEADEGHGELLVRFPRGEPPKVVLAIVKAEGFRYVNARKVWRLPLSEESRRRGEVIRPLLADAMAGAPLRPDGRDLPGAGLARRVAILEAALEALANDDGDDWGSAKHALKLALARSRATSAKAAEEPPEQTCLVCKRPFRRGFLNGFCTRECSAAFEDMP